MDTEAEEPKTTIISDAEFVKFWQGADNAQEVAEHFNLKRASVIQRACNLRKKGVRLKKYPRVMTGRAAREPSYYVDLNALAGQHGPLSDERATEPEDDDSESTDEI